MSGFKLLAIRPLDGCDKQFLKNLKPGMVYKFYQDYDYYVGNEKLTELNYKNLKGHPISEVKFSGNDVDLYSKPNGLNINISAVVGKNGSGKSALTEMFFLGVYVYYFKNIVSFQLTKDFESTEYIKPEEDLMTFCKRIEQTDEYNRNSSLKSEIDLITKKAFSLEIIFEIEQDKTVFTLNINNHDKNLIKSISGNKEISKIPFYTIVTNYSLFGLNHIFIGDWIQSIFHKNDAYQTPIVINPKRESGGYIDIENESSLQLNRLLLNLLEIADEEGLEFLLNKRRITQIKFKVKYYKFPISTSVKDFKSITYREGVTMNPNQLNKLYKKNLSEVFEMGKEYDELSEIEKIAFNYLADKLIRTAKTYKLNDSSKPLFDKENLEKFKSRESHIFFKINQAINFIKYPNFLKSEFDKNFPDFNPNSKNDREVEFETILVDLKNEIKIKDVSERINFLPPPFFSWNIQFSENKDDDFNNMSSGEKQLIYVIQTVVYHIRNILSSEIGKKENINLIFDEIELYFHPDYQRKFIKKLIDSLNIFFGESELNINILFLTHSPFILSDIPSNNILCLEDGITNGKLPETFASNVHDLLAHNFFLNEGFMGEFAKKKIESLIDFLASDQKETEIWNIQKSADFIRLIGEPFLKSDIEELFSAKKKSLMTEMEIEEEIRKLNLELQKRRL